MALCTSGPWCEVSLVAGRGGCVSMGERRLVGHAHTEALIPMVAGLLRRAGVSIAAVAGFAHEAGPGGFTGLRVACGVAQGLALAHDRPICAVDSLACAALDGAAMSQGRRRGGASDASEQRVFVAIDARMNECYVGGYRIAWGAALDDRRLSAAPRFGLTLAPRSEFAASACAVGQAGERLRAWLSDGDGPCLAVGDAFERYGALAALAGSLGVDCVPGARVTAGAIARIAALDARWGGAAQARLNYVRHKVALDVDEQRRLRSAVGRP